jgi:putative ABC transport system permease protein
MQQSQVRRQALLAIGGSDGRVLARMTLPRLVWTNIRESAFRSAVVLVCAFLLAGSAVLATLVVQGSAQHVRSTLQQLGSDILVLPFGIVKNELWTDAQFISTFTESWMPRTRLKEVAAVRGVAGISPQLYLATLHDPALSSESEAYLIAYDPPTDFTLRVWLPANLHGELALGEAIGGSSIHQSAAGTTLELLGYPIRLIGYLAPTGSDMDRGIFVSFETAQQIIERAGLNIMPGTVSAALVRVAEGSHPEAVAMQIMEDVPRVVPYETADFFQAQRSQLVGLIRGALMLLAITWLLSVLLIGLVFSISVDERRREIGVLRALGAPAGRVVQILLAEGALLASSGGLFGALIFLASASLLREDMTRVLGVPILLASPLTLVALVGLGLAVALLSVLLGVLVPAIRISREEPAATIRE